MDTQTVIALCDVLLVVIGTIGLVLVRREWRTVLAQNEAGHPH